MSSRTQTFSGRKVGACTWQDPAQQQRGMIAAQCQQAVDNLDWYAVTSEVGLCKEYRPALCGRVAQMATGGAFECGMAGNPLPSLQWVAECGMKVRVFAAGSHEP